jgi:hypothetical protein
MSEDKNVSMMQSVIGLGLIAMMVFAVLHLIKVGISTSSDHTLMLIILSILATVVTKSKK